MHASGKLWSLIQIIIWWRAKCPLKSKIVYFFIHSFIAFLLMLWKEWSSSYFRSQAQVCKCNKNGININAQIGWNGKITSYLHLELLAPFQCKSSFKPNISGEKVKGNAFVNSSLWKYKHSVWKTKPKSLTFQTLWAKRATFTKFKNNLIFVPKIQNETF